MKKNVKAVNQPIVIQAADSGSAGNVVGDLVSIIKGIFSTLCKGIDKMLDDKGYEPSSKAKPIKPTDSHGPGVQREYTSKKKHRAGSNEVFTVWTVKTELDGSGDRINVKITCPGHPDYIKENVVESQLQSLIYKYVDDVLEAGYEEEVIDTTEGEDEDSDVDASSKVCRVTLQRVTSSTGVDSINLMKIQANYPIKLAMEDVEEIVDNDEFVDTLGEDEPQSFEITQVPGEENPDELEYDVNEIANDEVDTSMSYEELLKAAAKFSFDIQCIGWGAKGPDMDNLRSRLYNFKWAAESAIDLFANLMVSETHVVPHLGKLPTGGTGGVDMSQGFDYQEGLTVLDKSIDKFIQTLEEHYINLSHEIQKRVDDLIFELKNGNSANIKRAMM